MRFCTLALALGLAGCQGDGGAVSVRWRIVDLSTGQAWDANTQSIDYRGACCLTSLDPVNHSCVNSNWQVNRVAVDLRDPTTGLSVLPPSAQPNASCASRELTSSFNLPPGSYAISLDAQTDMGPPPVTPPPQLRQIERGAVVNLDVVEIGVDPLPHPLPTPDGGVTP